MFYAVRAKKGILTATRSVPQSPSQPRPMRQLLAPRPPPLPSLQPCHLHPSCPPRPGSLLEELEAPHFLLLVAKQQRQFPPHLSSSMQPSSSCCRRQPSSSLVLPPLDRL